MRALLGGLALLAMSASGCGWFDDESIDGVWQIVEIDGQPVEIGENTIEAPFLVIDVTDLAATLGCNDGTGSIRLDDDTAVVTDLSVSALDCEPEALRFADRAVGEVLASDTIAVRFADDDRLIWDAEGRQLVLVSVPEPPP